MRVALALGHTQAWLAAHINHGNEFHYALLVIPWAITRGLFIAAFSYCCWRHRDCFQA